MKNKDMFINLIANIILFSVNLIISFFITPFIVKQLGEAAYGFIGLINNLISYASIATVALNSMAGRFITIAVHRSQDEKASKYFTSVLYGNAFISVIILVLCSIALFNLNAIINIPSYLEHDVKMSFVFMSLEFIISLMSSVYSLSTIITNKLYLSSMKSIESSIIRIIIVGVLFYCFKPHIYFLSIASFIVALFLLFANYKFKKRLIPNIIVKRGNFEISAVLLLIKSGIWNCLNQISSILNTGLSLLLTNIILGPSLMGILSIAKTIPNYFISFTSSIVNVFTPQMTIDFAKENTNDVILVVDKSVKILSLFSGIIFAFCICYSYDFYRLWVPTTSTILLYQLTILSVFHMPITSGMNSLYNIFTVTNNVKTTGLVLFINSVFNISIVLILSLFIEGQTFIYVITGISSFTAIFVFLFFTIPYSAYCLNLKKTTFLKQLFVCIKITLIIVIVFSLFKFFVPLNNWLSIFLVSAAASFTSLILVVLLFWDKAEIQLIVKKLRGILWKKF